MRSSRARSAAFALAALPLLAASPLHAAGEAEQLAVAGEAGEVTGSVSPADSESFPARAAIRALIDKEVAKTRLPADIAEAVVFVESRYDPSVIGRVGEIGLMQVRPGTAAQLGFRGSNAELARPEINIHYGVTYLAGAWRLARGDLCRALMKYRAGHGEETMTARSTIYCNRARNRLIAMRSPFAAPGAIASVAPDPAPVNVLAPAKRQPARALSRSAEVYATFKQGTPAASRAFWAAHEARIRVIRARIEAKWHRVASR